MESGLPRREKKNPCTLALQSNKEKGENPILAAIINIIPLHFYLRFGSPTSSSFTCVKAQETGTTSTPRHHSTLQTEHTNKQPESYPFGH